MPIYEYGCENCGHVEEIFQKISDDPLSECPKCHGRIKKLMSMNTFHLKGSGWYVTDYASKSSSSPSSPAAKSSESKTDSKPGESSATKTSKSSESSPKSSKD